MRSRVALFLVLALAVQARAATVSNLEAIRVAKTWSRSAKTTGAKIGTDVSSVRSIGVNGEVALHAVRMEGGGTVFVAGDDALEPVIAFTESAPAEDGPLMDILKLDAFLRKRAVKARSNSASAVRQASNASSSSSGRASFAASAIERKWSVLSRVSTAAEESGGPTVLRSSTLMAAAPNSYAENEAEQVLSEIRVSPLLQSRWGQTTVDGKNGTPLCYNYYTPNHFPCGCGATAMSQIFYYHRYPAVLPQYRENGYLCSVANVETNLFVIADPDNMSQAKPYDWAAMVGNPDLNTSESAREAIGHFTYDVSVVMGSSFSETGTFTQPEGVATAITEFGYPVGFLYVDGESWSDETKGPNADSALRNNLILASLDAKMPVQLGIYGWAKYSGQVSSWPDGHSVVADGYGMADVDGEKTTYVHINLGWDGDDNAWYNLPEIDTASVGALMDDSNGYDFRFIGDIAFDITTNETAVGKELLTGRVADTYGNARSDATVSVYDVNGGLVAETRPDEKGVYFFWLEGGASYDVWARSDDGELDGASDGPVALGTTVASEDRTISSPENVGNRWGVDVELTIPRVRIGDATYPSLDRALDAAVAGDTVEILHPAVMKRPYILDKDVTITATNADAYASAVTFRDGAKLTVTNGVAALTNIVFVSEVGATVVDVSGAGRIDVAGVASFGSVEAELPGVTTETSQNFRLVGELLSGMVLDCAAAPDGGDVFGSYACDEETARKSALLIVSLEGDDRAGTTAGGIIKWKDDSTVTEETALVSVSKDGSDPALFRTLDKLLKNYRDETGDILVTLLRSRVTLNEDCELAGSSANWTVTAAEGDGRIVFGGNAAIALASGVNFTVVDVTLAGGSAISATSPVTVGSGATFTLDSGAALTGFGVANGKHVIDVEGGRLVMKEGSGISSCAMATGGGNGTVFLANGAVFDFEGGAITGCTAGSAGGAVYVNRGTTVNVSGSATAADNKDGKDSSNDIYLAAASNLVLAGPLKGSGGIGVCGTGAKVYEGCAFASVKSGVGDSVALQACALFLNEADPDLYAGVSGSTLVWSAEPPAAAPVDESEAVAKVADKFYRTLSDAFNAAEGTATITLLADADFTESVAVTNGTVTLDGAGYTLTRSGAGTACFAVSNATFTVKNVTVSGGTGRVIDAYRSELTLDSGAAIEIVTGYDASFVAPVVVWGGKFTMNSGASVTGCSNSYQRELGDGITAGAIAVSGFSETGGETGTAEAHLNGGTVTGCSSSQAGGIYIGNGATVDIKGDLVITNNTAGGAVCNLLVNDLSALTLVGELTGSVGYTEGIDASETQFGTTTLSGDAASASAAKFTHDANNATGLVHTDGTTLIWGPAPGPVDPDDPDNPDPDDPDNPDPDDPDNPDDPDPEDPTTETVSPAPIAFKSITETEAGWELVITNRVPYCWYRLVYTSDLMSGFTVTGAWEQAAADATPEWTTNIVTTTPAFFWKAEAKDGEKPISE